VVDQIPFIEFSHSLIGKNPLIPSIRLSTGEMSEKERIIQIDVYTLTILLNVPEKEGHGNYGENDCYVYAASIEQALREDPTLGGIADRAVMTGKKYIPPKNSGVGDTWEAALTLRITIEGMSI
jgi:hypothetical protein